jgi:hypothetical protein
MLLLFRLEETMEHAALHQADYAELSTSDLLSINGGEMIPAWWVILLLGSALSNSGEIIEGFSDGFNATH